MNLVLNAAVPLTATYKTEERLERVQKLNKAGRPDITIVEGRPLVATEERPIQVRVVAERLDLDAQQAREEEVITVLAAAIQQVGALDARLATRFHGTVDLTTWKA